MNNYFGLAVLDNAEDTEYKLYNLVAGNAHTASTLMKEKHGKDLAHWCVFHHELETLLVNNNKEQQIVLEQLV